MAQERVFLLSPAHCGGKRAKLLFRSEAQFGLALGLRSPGGVPLSEVFSFLSGLYFRGKLAYARSFERPPQRLPGAFVITGGRGLLAVETPVTLADLAGFAEVPIDPTDSRYREPLLTDTARLAATIHADCGIVLLGSIATAKYVELLLTVLGARLCFPEPFIGLGDMARGSLLLRSAAAGMELPYVPAASALRSRTARRRPGAAGPR
jgi:hypothetical protein